MTKAPSISLEKIILSLVFILANLRALIFIFLFPDTSNLFGAAWMEILLWAIAALGVLYLLIREKQIPNYMVLWRRNWLLALFIGLAFISIIWSVAPVASLFRSLELFFATLIAAYFGMRLLPGRIMDALFWFGAAVFILSIALAYGAPPTGTMYWKPFDGAWRGIYWHRNHLASIAAFLNAVYLMRILIAWQNRNRDGLLDCAFYILSLLIMYFARSATGYILLIVLNLFVLIVWIWLRLSDRLKKQHYIVIFGLGILGLVLVLTNLNFVFGFFNRDTTLTGRIGLWSHLLDMAYDRLWLGHGFGAFWMLDALREQIRQLAGWASQPLIGDNGFLDILLHLGVIGLLLFLSVFILGAVRSFRYGFAQKTLPGFFPLLVFVYAFFANLTFSLFVETEVFVWFLIVSTMFMTTPLGKTDK